jgi:DNA-binding response OmpR family regulator
VPVLICTASRDLLDAHRKILEEFGCVVVEKPFNLDELLAAITRCLSPAS